MRRLHRQAPFDGTPHWRHCFAKPMISNATTVEEYIESLAPDRRAAIQAVREVILAHLPQGFEECLLYGMISYVVPHQLYPAGYHCDPSKPLPYASLGSQKNHMAIYLMNVYGDSETEQWFRKAFEETGKKLNMGKSCVRFRKVADLPLEVIGQAIARTPVKKYIARCEEARRGPAKKRGQPKKVAPQAATGSGRTSA